MEVITRKEAISLGLKRYYTGIPCKHGHLSEYLVSSGCIECLKKKNIKRRGERYKEDVEFRDKERLRKKDHYNRNKQQYLNRRRKYRKDNPEAEFIRRSLERLKQGYTYKLSQYEEILGYTRVDLLSHMENLFLEGMSWDNYGDWHIDHIKPISVFVKEGVTDPKVVNSLSNLQPLWAIDNLSKGSRY